MLNLQQEHLLATHLRMCGYFLYYQTGKKAGQQRILATLLNRKSVTQKELQNILEISSGALSEILQKMEDANLVERKRSCDDKRRVVLTLTRKGEDRARKVKAHYSYTLTRMFGCLSREEKTQLGAILEKLTTHLDTLKTDALFEAEPAGI